jgi:pSer/pThr/pTyr-binding forkhead associated (FHA) protein
LNTQEEANKKAFVIVNGAHIVPLNQPVTSIGRKKDNIIVINNPHASRYHAQIHMSNGRFVVVDLDSTAGTSLNGDRVQRAALEPGDVISIGGVPIIFGQGPRVIPSQSNPPAEPLHTDTGPTDVTNLRELDGYLDLFESSQDD